MTTEPVLSDPYIINSSIVVFQGVETEVFQFAFKCTVAYTTDVEEDGSRFKVAFLVDDEDFNVRSVQGVGDLEAILYEDKLIGNLGKTVRTNNYDIYIIYTHI